MTSLQRRKFVKQSIVVGAVGSILSSFNLFAAWPESAYKQESISDALKHLFGDSTPIESDKIQLKIPNIAENGAVVPINVKTSLENVDSIGIFVAKNPNPLVARFTLHSVRTADINSRIKMGKSSEVVAIVRSNGKLYASRKFVKVTIGGCGGG